MEKISVNSEDLIKRRDGLFYKKHAKIPFTGNAEEFWKNGKLKSSDSYQNGILHGPYEWHYENGRKSSTGSVNQGKPTSSERYFDKKGNLLNGPFEWFYKNGALRCRVNTKKGRHHGACEWFYENGQLFNKQKFINGKRQGPYEFFYENGQLHSKSNSKNGGLHGALYLYYEDGELKSEQNYTNGTQDGPVKWYYKGGQLSSRRFYKENIAEGLHEWFYENGQLLGFNNFKEGRKHGISERYYENGKLEWRQNYKQGKLHGISERYFKNGKIKSHENFQYGELITKDTIGRGVGSGIRVGYSHKEAKLEVFFQIPTLQQLKEFKITKFNKDPWSIVTKNLQGKKITKETYKFFLKSIVERFSEKEDFDTNFNDMPYETLEVSPYYDEDELFFESLKSAKEALHKAILKIDPKYKVPLNSFNEDRFYEWTETFEYEGCAFYFVLIANGWSTEIFKKGKNTFVKWTFTFDKLTNKLVDEVFNAEIHNGSIYSWIGPGMRYDENFIHMMYSPFELDEYLLYYPHSITKIFEHKLDPKSIIRKEPLKDLPDSYERV